MDIKWQQRSRLDCPARRLGGGCIIRQNSIFIQRMRIPLCQFQATRMDIFETTEKLFGRQHDQSVLSVRMGPLVSLRGTATWTFMSEKVGMTDFKHGTLIEKFSSKRTKIVRFPWSSACSIATCAQGIYQQVFGTPHNTGNSLILNKRLHRNRLPEIAYRFSFAS